MNLLITYGMIVMGSILLATGVLVEDGYRYGDEGDGGPAPALPSRIAFVAGGTLFMVLGFAQLFGFINLPLEK